MSYSTPLQDMQHVFMLASKSTWEVLVAMRLSGRHPFAEQLGPSEGCLGGLKGLERPPVPGSGQGLCKPVLLELPEL